LSAIFFPIDRVLDRFVTRNLASIRPNFIVKDLQASITYYCERLGFGLDFQGPDDGPFWAGVSRDGIGIMLKAVAPDVLPIPNHTRHQWAPADAHVYSVDPDALFDEFSRRGASFVKTLSFIEAGLWGFTIIDADGYVLAFFQLRDN
jgi:catechol 2,3-dioxygenase-like lactoylglutathione lyase family enzyme